MKFVLKQKRMAFAILFCFGARNGTYEPKFCTDIEFRPKVKRVQNDQMLSHLRGSASVGSYQNKKQGGKPLCFLFWCEKRDLNPYGVTTRPSNVRVCQFRHSRICRLNNVQRYLLYTIFLICQDDFLSFFCFLESFLKNSSKHMS